MWGWDTERHSLVLTPHSDVHVDEQTARVLLVLCGSPKALPSQPAPRVVHELRRRWDRQVGSLILHPPSRAVAHDLGVTLYPTWIVFTRENGDAPWVERERRVGAMPKHAVARMVGTAVTLGDGAVESKGGDGAVQSKSGDGAVASADSAVESTGADG